MTYEELVRYNESVTGLACPPSDAPMDTHYQWFVAQVSLIMYQTYSDPSTARRETLQKLAGRKDYSKLRPFVERAFCGDPVTG